MRVAFVNPGKNQNYAMQEPLNLGFIAGYLESQGHKVTIIDELAGQNVMKDLKSFEPEIVGLTAVTPLAPDAYRIADLCKKEGYLTVMGGVHASVLPEEALEHVDIVIKGEGEYTFETIINEKTSEGIVLGKYVENIDALPLPARHLMDMEYYARTKDRIPHSVYYFIPPNTRMAGMVTSRGCPYSCIYCHNSWKGLPYRMNSPEHVIDEMRQLIEVYNIQAIFFNEDNFFFNKQRAQEICHKIIDNGFDIAWGATSSTNGIDRKTLEIAKEAGCKQVTFGFESGSDRILKILKKRSTVEQNYAAVKLCNDIGIMPQGTVMLGNPTETVDDICETQKFVRTSGLKHIGVCITTAYPGTELWQQAKAQGKVPDNIDWSTVNLDKINIQVCDTIDPETLKKLHLETSAILSKNEYLTISDITNVLKTNPEMITEVIKDPKRIKRIVKRLLIKKDSN